MILASPGSVAFEILGISIYWYGVFMALAIFAGVTVAQWAYKAYFSNKNIDLLENIFPWLVICGILGARLYYCILNHSYYFSNPLQILNIREGGLSIHGMFIACLIFLITYSKRNKINLFTLTAPMCLGVAIAQSIGRWGNFFNSEAFGKPYDGLIKLYIPQYLRPECYKNVTYFHPTFLYESVLDFLIFIILLILLKKNVKNPLFITSIYFLMYSVVRIFVENLRIDSVSFVFGLPIAMVVSLLILAISVFGIIISLKSKKS